MRALLQRVVTVLAALVVGLFTVEFLLRAFDVVDRLNGYNRLLFTQSLTDDVPYRLRPGVETTFLATPVRVNSLGFRGPECAPTPSPGVHRMLLLGDSVAFGFGVDEQDTLAAVLQRLLSAETGIGYEVINTGVPGFDSVAAVRLLEAAAPTLQPATIVLAMSLNDYEPALRYDPLGVLTRTPRGSGATSPIERSEFALLIRWLLGYARGTLGFQRHERLTQAREATLTDGGAAAAVYERVVRDQHLRFYRDPDPVLWGRIQDAFRDLRRFTEDRGVAALVAIFPEAHQMTEPDLTPQRRILEACGEARLRCLDLLPAFAAEGGDLFADTQHPNARGLAVAGAAIAGELVSSLRPP